MKSLCLLLSVVTLALSGCAMVLDAPSAEDRSVTSLRDPSKSLTLQQPGELRNLLGTRGLRLPPGLYRLEAQDADYLYFAAPSVLDYQILVDGRIADRQTSPGGIALAKRLALVPASGYSSIGAGRKLLTWKLGAEFMAEEGRRWKRSF